MLWKSSLSLISTWIKRLYNDYGSEGDEYKAFLSQSERWPKPWKVVLTFESVDKIYDLTIQMKPLRQYFHICFSNFWVYGWNPMVWPFKWNLFRSTFTWYYLYSMFFQLWTESVVWPFKWNSFGSTFTCCYLFSSILRNKVWIFAIIIFLCIQVYVVLHGEGQVSNPIELKCEGRHLFQRSSCDVFVVR